MVHGVEPGAVHFQCQERTVGGLPVNGLGAIDMGKVTHAAQQPAGDARRAASAACDFVGAIGADADAEHAGTAVDDLLQFLLGIEIEPHRNAETVAQRIGQQPGARCGADQREWRQVDLHRARRWAFADDEIELEILHRRIEDFFHCRIEPVNLVDEQDVARLEIGEQCRQVAGFRDHWPRCGAEVHAQFARDDLRQRGLAEARRADEQHVVERFLARTRGLDEHRQISARLLLADEFRQPLRPQRSICVVVAFFGSDKAAGAVHFASSFKPCLISVAVSAPSPALRVAAAMAAAACGCP